MADQENRNQGQTTGQQQKDSVLGQQAGGDGAQANLDQGGGTNPYSQGPEPTGTFKDQAQQTQGQGASTDQLGQNFQSYGQSTQHDTTFGQGPGQASLGAEGQTGVLGPRPGQSDGQPSSAATGGPDLSQGLKDQNNQGGSGA